MIRLFNIDNLVTTPASHTCMKLDSLLVVLCNSDSKSNSFCYVTINNCLANAVNIKEFSYVTMYNCLDGTRLLISSSWFSVQIGSV